MGQMAEGCGGRVQYAQSFIAGCQPDPVVGVFNNIFYNILTDAARMA